MASILGVKYGDDLFSQFPSKGKDAFNVVRLSPGGRYKRIQLTARRTWQWRATGTYIRNNPRWPRTEKILSGGVVIECDVRSDLIRNAHKTIYLKSGWTEATFKRAVQRIFDWALPEVHRQLLCEQVHRVAETCHGEDFSNAVDAEETRLGKNSDYSSMTVEDAEHWLAWVQAWREKTCQSLPS